MSMTLQIFSAFVSERERRTRKILREHKHSAAVYQAVTATTPSPEYCGLASEILAASFFEAIELFERSVVEQDFDALARRHLAAAC